MNLKPQRKRLHCKAFDFEKTAQEINSSGRFPSFGGKSRKLSSGSTNDNIKAPCLMTKADSQEVEDNMDKVRESLIKPTFLTSNRKSHSELLQNSKSSHQLVNESDTPTFTPKRKLKFSQKVNLFSKLEKCKKEAESTTNGE